MTGDRTPLLDRTTSDAVAHRGRRGPAGGPETSHPSNPMARVGHHGGLDRGRAAGLSARPLPLVGRGLRLAPPSAGGTSSPQFGSDWGAMESRRHFRPIRDQRTRSAFTSCTSSPPNRKRSRWSSPRLARVVPGVREVPRPAHRATTMWRRRRSGLPRGGAFATRLRIQRPPGAVRLGRSSDSLGLGRTDGSAGLSALQGCGQRLGIQHLDESGGQETGQEDRQELQVPDRFSTCT